MAPCTVVAIETVIVDDEADMRLLLRSLLAAEGITVTGEAADGDEAVDAYADLRPDVLVLDERMPRMHGLEVVRALRARGDDPQVVLWSANLTSCILREAGEL